MGNPSNMLLNDVSNDSSLILDDIDVKHDPSAHMMIGNLNPGGNKNFKQFDKTKAMMESKGQLSQPIGGGISDDSFDMQGQGGSQRLLHDPAIIDEMAQNFSAIDPRSQDGAAFSISGIQGFSEESPMTKFVHKDASRKAAAAPKIDRKATGKVPPNIA